MSEKHFTGRIRKNGSTVAVTIPPTVREALGLKEGDLCDFSVKLSKPNAND